MTRSRSSYCTRPRREPTVAVFSLQGSDGHETRESQGSGGDTGVTKSISGESYKDASIWSNDTIWYDIRLDSDLCPSMIQIRFLGAKELYSVLCCSINLQIQEKPINVQTERTIGRLQGIVPLPPPLGAHAFGAKKRQTRLAGRTRDY